MSEQLQSMSIRAGMEHGHETSVQLHLGDALPFMKTLADKSVDVIVADPPYGLNENNEKNSKRGLLARPRNFGHYERDRQRLGKEYFDEMLRVSRNQIIFGGEHYSDFLPQSSGWIFWDKH